MLDKPTGAIELREIARVATIAPAAFQSRFLRREQPVVIEDLAAQWPARNKWSPQFFRDSYGDRPVKVYDASFAEPGDNYLASLRTVSLAEYIDRVVHSDADLRMFLYDLVSEIPELQEDILIPDIADGFSRRFIFMFFGCRGSLTPMHYDIDMSHVFHTQLHGRKRVMLFAPDQSRNLYRHPCTVRSYVDLDNPDLDRFPRLAELRGWKTVLNPGDTLFIPSGYWHHVLYLDGGYAVSLRCRHERIVRRAQGVANVLAATLVDWTMNRLFGERWFRWKENGADRRAAR